jgi:hypothetical protein
MKSNWKLLCLCLNSSLFNSYPFLLPARSLAFHAPVTTLLIQRPLSCFVLFNWARFVARTVFMKWLRNVDDYWTQWEYGECLLGRLYTYFNQASSTTNEWSAVVSIRKMRHVLSLLWQFPCPDRRETKSKRKDNDLNQSGHNPDKCSNNNIPFLLKATVTWIHENTKHIHTRRERTAKFFYSFSLLALISSGNVASLTSTLQKYSFRCIRI